MKLLNCTNYVHLQQRRMYDTILMFKLVDIDIEWECIIQWWEWTKKKHCKNAIVVS